MAKSNPIIIFGAVEGDVDEIVLRRLIERKNFCIGGIYGRKGKDFLKQKIGAYNEAAKHNRWIVLVDLNASADCAPNLVSLWIPDRNVQMSLRVVVRAIESWLLSDKKRMAEYLNISEKHIPINPEILPNPKQTLVNLAKKSRSRQIREDMIPREGSGRDIGPAYTSRLIDFISNHRNGWRPDVAAESSNSLKRCLNAINGMNE